MSNKVYRLKSGNIKVELYAYGKVTHLVITDTDIELVKMKYLY